jgi:hypothetical protein
VHLLTKKPVLTTISSVGYWRHDQREGIEKRKGKEKKERTRQEWQRETSSYAWMFRTK